MNDAATLDDRIAAAGTAGPPPAPAATAAPLLRCEEVVLGFGARTVLQGLTFEVDRGEVLAVIGGSGSGKSTLLRSLIGLHEPAAGRVLYGTRDLYRSDDATLSVLRREFGVMFQAGALWSSMSVGENVMLPLQLVGALSNAECEREARFKLALVGLADDFDTEPPQLSGGMKKRAAIARALALDPPLLFLDEPTAGLDPLTAARLDELVAHLRDDLGTTIVMVTHDLQSIHGVADRVLFVDAAERTMTALGAPAELLAHGPHRVREFLRRTPLHGSTQPLQEAPA